jgi:hypothetical protein
MNFMKDLKIYKRGGWYRIGYKGWFGVIVWVLADWCEELIWETDSYEEAEKRLAWVIACEDKWEAV